MMTWKTNKQTNKQKREIISLNNIKNDFFLNKKTIITAAKKYKYKIKQIIYYITLDDNMNNNLIYL